LRNHLAVPRPLSIWIILIGVIAPWCVGIYFAYRAARAANKTLRAIGSMEVLVFLLGLAVPLVAHG
jgi:membrane protein CcdC involved in cytochrome C biogenesis